MDKIRFIVIICTLSLVNISKAQETQKNNLSINFSFIEADRNPSGELSSKGIDVSYERYFKKRFYGTISYGLYHFEGRNSIFLLEPEEMDFINMRAFNLGVGYDVVQTKRFVLSGEITYMRQSTQELISQLESGGLIIRETGTIRDQTARVQLKARIFLTENLQLIPAIAHGFQVSKYKSDWLRIGIGYSF
jgi:hypothetical protein